MRLTIITLANVLQIVTLKKEDCFKFTHFI